MNGFSRIALTAALMGSIALPALAQTPSAGNATTAPATHNTTPRASTSAATAPSERNPILTDNGNIRTSKLVGSSVYNDHNEKIGSVDEVILNKDNKAENVILSVGGFLGMGSKLVAVPYSQLQLGDTNNASSNNRVVMAGATKDSLKSMPAFHYTGRS